MQSGKKILLIEDDKLIALALKIRLQAEGYAVTVAYDCESAMRAVTALLPDVALIDCNLPDGNGIDVMQQFSQGSETSEISSIIMTASNKQGLQDKAMAAGAFDYFQKPFNSSALIESIRHACVQDADQVAQGHH